MIEYELVYQSDLGPVFKYRFPKFLDAIHAQIELINEGCVATEIRTIRS